MGKATKWLRSLLSSKKSSRESSSKENNNKNETIKWAIPSNSKNSSVNFKNAVEDSHHVVISPYVDGLDANKHAIAVAAATAAVAEAALAAAQAAAEVVKLTSGVGSARIAAAYRAGDRRPVLAAVKIQSAFRAYLARRALRALKGLVKLQALVRGHFVRKQSADMLRRMQAMARIQARASAHRSSTPEPYNGEINFLDSHHHQMQHSHSRSYIGASRESSGLGTNWLDHWMEQYAQKNIRASAFEHGRCDDERSDKILEIDTWKPHQNVQRKDQRASPSTSQYFSAWNEMGGGYSKTGPSLRLSAKLLKPNTSVSSEEVSSVISLNFPPEIDRNSPRVHSASSRPVRGPFTPARSDCSRSLYGDYLSHPNYMTNTESSRAKVRSQSAPKQRLQSEELGLNVKYGSGLWESDANSEKGAYVYTGQLKRQATPSGVGFGPRYGYRL